MISIVLGMLLIVIVGMTILPPDPPNLGQVDASHSALLSKSGI